MSPPFIVPAKDEIRNTVGMVEYVEAFMIPDPEYGRSTPLNENVKVSARVGEEMTRMVQTISKQRIDPLPLTAAINSRSRNDLCAL